MLTMLYKQPPRADDADEPARLAVGGAATKELWRPFEQRFGLEILEIYGLTETACVCVSSPPDDIRPGTIGKAVSWSEVEVLDPQGQPAADGEPGEICVRSNLADVLTPGYYKNPDATAQAYDGGWFHTGDRGIRDADGYLTFVDRIKDSIRRRGENISSYEIERVVNAHPAVAESGAVGVPSELGEDEVMVVVVPVPGAQLEPDELISFCRERIASFMVPRYVKLTDRLPKTGTERVQKFVLRAEGATGAWDRQTAHGA
jgi:crotonobetaine/carnitine-CoA ligase